MVGKKSKEKENMTKNQKDSCSLRRETVHVHLDGQDTLKAHFRRRQQLNKIG